MRDNNKHKHKKKHRHVRFCLPGDEYLIEDHNNSSNDYESLSDDSKEEDDRRLLWYSKRELSANRQELRRTILLIRNCGGSDLFIRQMEGYDDEERDDICFRGCERYYNLEARFMAQKTLVDAIMEAQEGGGGTAEAATSDDHDALLRNVSESLSQSCKELAAWHAKLNAFQCWGFKGLVATPRGDVVSSDKETRVEI